MSYFRCTGGGSSTPATLITKNISANGTYNASSDSADGYSKVVVSVSPNVGTKAISSNGTYNASSDSLDGYSSVTVTVPANVVSGTFTSATSQYGTVTVNCGFQPDFVIVTLPFDGQDTVAYWWREASWGNQYSCWNLYPIEWSVYFPELGRSDGETGIQSITSTGFKFMSNASNTQGVTCKYVAGKY